MKEFEKIRIYTNVRKLDYDYYAVTYKEYDSNGKQTGYGVEYFSGKRFRTATKLYLVYQYNGRENKAGGKMTDCIGSVRVSRNTSGLKAAIIIYGNVARVEKI